VLDCQGPGVPWSRVYSLPKNEKVSDLDLNPEIRRLVSATAMPFQKTFEIDLPDTDVPARVRLLLPPSLRESEEYIFPLIVNVYGGPGSQVSEIKDIRCIDVIVEKINKSLRYIKHKTIMVEMS